MIDAIDRSKLSDLTLSKALISLPGKTPHIHSSLTVVSPVLNEIDTIEELLHLVSLEDLVNRMVICDNGSGWDL